MYTALEHYIDGNWVKPSGDKSQDVMNPATSKPIGTLGHVSRGDLDKAIAAADKGFKQWRKVSSYERGKILRKAADLVRARTDEIAKVLTMEEGKVLMEAKLEVASAADIIDWYAGEGQRAYGRIIPARADGVRNLVTMEPIGVVAGFSPWNFPVTQAVRKIAASLAARLLDHHQVPRRDAGLADRAREVLPRCWACRRACSTWSTACRPRSQSTSSPTPSSARFPSPGRSRSAST